MPRLAQEFDGLDRKALLDIIHDLEHTIEILKKRLREEQGRHDDPVRGATVGSGGLDAP